MKFYIKGDLRNFLTGTLEWCLSKHCKIAFTDKTLERLNAELKRRDGEGSDAI